MYSAKYILLNKIGITNKLANIFNAPAVIPFLGRSVAPAPAPATNVSITGNTLKWNTTGSVRSVVYYFADLKKEGVVLAITDAKELPVSTAGHYSVSTINADNLESKPSDVAKK